MMLTLGFSEKKYDTQPEGSLNPGSALALSLPEGGIQATDRHQRASTCKLQLPLKIMYVI